MSLKIFVLACALAVAHARYFEAPAAHYAVAPAALTATADNILRSPGNLAQVATQSKTIATPFSSSSKSDIRVSNPGVYAHAAPVSYVSPLAHGASTVSYAAPVAQYAAPVAQYAAPVAQYAAPVAQYAAPVAQYAAHGTAGGLLGVAYSPAVAVSHMSYSSPVGISYAW